MNPNIMINEANKPINATNHGKLLVFLLFLILSSFAFVGVVPLIFLIYFAIQFNRYKDFSYIEVSAKFMRIYIHVIASIGISIALFNFITSSYGKDGYFAAACFGSVAWGVGLYMVNNFFLNPLRMHSKWVELHGIFGTPRNEVKSIEAKQGVIKTTDSKYYSIADELLKCAALKEAGHISDQEFVELRAKILSK